MLRVAITGGPGSGKSTIAALFAQRGAHVVSSDDVARRLMQPGQEVYRRIVEHFGDGVVRSDGTLDRSRLAQLAFQDGRVRELEVIVHPAVLAWQSAWAQELERSDPASVAMVESALVFESGYTALKSGDVTLQRFDRIVLVAAPDALKRARFIERAAKASSEPLSEERRTALEADAERRLALQIPDAEKAPRCDFVITNDGSLAKAEKAVDDIWIMLKTEASGTAPK